MEATVLNNYIESQFLIFRAQFFNDGMSMDQRLRGLSIVWLMYCFSDELDIDLTCEIASFTNIQNDLELNAESYKLAPLNAACFIISKSDDYLNDFFEILLHTPKEEISYVLDCFAIFAPMMHSNNKYLKSFIEEAISNNNYYFNELAYFYLSTKGDSNEKMNWLRKQKSIADETGADFFKTLLHPSFVHANKSFADMFNQVKSFIIFNIFANGKQAPNIVFANNSIETFRSKDLENPFNFNKIKFDYFYSRE
jgi:hypothetical protein